MKNNYICSVPFTSLEVHENTGFLCCATWLTKHLPKNSSPKQCWESQEANDIRDSILDGSYKFCDENHCPHLNAVKASTPLPSRTPLILQHKLKGRVKDTVEAYRQGNLQDPVNLQFSFDRSCNLKCPSCRIEIITAGSKKIKEVQATIEEIENTYSQSIEQLYITGTGDPFISVGFRKFLQNFNPTKYPKLRNIHLHTNATKWNKKMWDSMPSIHKYVNTCEISIDAGTKGTYENKTRLGGDWDELIENLKFISTIPTLKRIITSFVVQQSNYKEMYTFRELIYSIFQKRAKVYFSKITNWGTFSEKEFKKHQIWNLSHPEHSLFLEELNKTIPHDIVSTNMHEYITKGKYLFE